MHWGIWPLSVTQAKLDLGFGEAMAVAGAPVGGGAVGKVRATAPPPPPPPAKLTWAAGLPGWGGLPSVPPLPPAPAAPSVPPAPPKAGPVRPLPGLQLPPHLPLDWPVEPSAPRPPFATRKPA